MYRTIIAWPYLEIGLTNWIAFALNVRISETAILLGAMDTRNKLDKLKALYVHRNSDKEAVALLKEMAKEHKAHADIRNTIAHAMTLGSSLTDSQCVYFLTSRAVPDEHGFMSVLRFHARDFADAREFAISRAADIRNLLKARGVEVE